MVFRGPSSFGRFAGRLGFAPGIQRSFGAFDETAPNDVLLGQHFRDEDGGVNQSESDAIGRFVHTDAEARFVVAAARLAESRELAVASSKDSAAVSRVSPSTEKTVDAAALVLVAMLFSPGSRGWFNRVC
jgi:hypothetical protein